eukprot:TRINITY_DN1476_c1_g1_i1.p1 TRINITY_DN1476_c1_g1~~TRINITY_DN1476_c1_g1_i1.p1  ORF type:complete len:116 (-),score=56.13 TRINITY_DN1476_c1_g1_i1:98-445(-)
MKEMNKKKNVISIIEMLFSCISAANQLREDPASFAKDLAIDAAITVGSMVVEKVAEKVVEKVAEEIEASNKVEVVVADRVEAVVAHRVEAVDQVEVVLVNNVVVDGVELGVYNFN